MGRAWSRFKQRLRLDAVTSCCGSGGWRHHRRGTPTHVLSDGGDGDYDNEYVDNVPFQEEGEGEVVEGEEDEEEAVVGATEFGCVVIREAEPAAEGPDPDRMDLATALAAERQLRATSLMRLLEQAGREKTVKNSKYAADYDDDDGGGGSRGDDEDQEEDDDNDDEEGENGGWGRCCVCMEGRRKRAAFIPCGHAFCRQCARELWFGHGSCPLCNRPIRDVLRIF